MEQINLTIREATYYDEQSIYLMICDLENVIFNRSAFAEVFKTNVTAANIAYFIAEIDGHPVGMASCHIQPLLHHASLVSEIQEMYVDPTFRSQNIGHELMTYVVEYAKMRGAIQLEVTSRATREPAHRFYQKEGFEKSHVKLVRYFGSEN